MWVGKMADKQTALYTRAEKAAYIKTLYQLRTVQEHAIIDTFRATTVVIL